MKKLVGILSLWLALGVFSQSAPAANVNIDALPAASSVAGTDLLECEQGGVNRKCTAAQTAAYVYGLMSGDATASGSGALTFATVNSNVGSFGSATNCVTLTVNAKGLITAASAATCTPAMSSVTGRAALSQLPQGIANSIWINPTGSTADMQNVAVPACANDGTHALVYVNGTGLQCATITAGGTGTVTSVAAGCGTSTGGSPITSTGTLTAAITRRTNSTTSDTIIASDCGNLVYESNASAIAVSIAQAGTTGFASGTFFQVCNIGAGTATITPTTSTIGGASSFPLLGGSALYPRCVGLQSDGTNYNLVGAQTATIAKGTATLGTSAISSGTCATVVTVPGANIATTDVITTSFNGDPTGVTGYAPSVNGMLTIDPYPSSGNANFKVCNNTASSITPGAITLNWQVIR